MDAEIDKLLKTGRSAIPGEILDIAREEDPMVDPIRKAAERAYRGAVSQRKEYRSIRNYR